MEVAVARRVSVLPCCRIDSSGRRKQCLAASVKVRNPVWESGDLCKRLSVTCGERNDRKEKRKLAKGLEKNLALFASMQFGIDPSSGLAGRVQGSVMTEAAEVILRKLQSLREAEEEAKRKRKQKKKKHKTKSMGIQKFLDFESTADSGDARNQKSTDFNSSWKEKFLSTQAIIEEDSKSSSAAAAVARVLLRSLESIQSEQHGDNVSLQEAAQPLIAASPSQTHTEAKKVEICIGGKCRKSGASQLLEQFQSLAAEREDVNVVGCKCMGMCKKGPNVRLSASNRAPALCSGVEIGDVGALLASFSELK